MTIEYTDRLLTPGQVAALFRVDPKTVTRWASTGRIGSIRTPGRAPPVPGIGDPGAAGRVDGARSAAVDRLITLAPSRSPDPARTGPH